MSKRIIEDRPEMRPSFDDDSLRGDGWREKLPAVLGMLLIVFGLFTGTIAYFMVRTHNANPFTATVSYFVPAPESLFNKERVYIMLLGLDYDYTNQDYQTSQNARTDKIEIFALDFPSHVVKSIAVPRDMDAIVAGHEDKINDAYHYGKELNTDRVVGQFLGMTKNEHERYFDRYITLRIDATKDFINAIGGLDVPVTETLNYDDNWGHLHIHFKPGLVHMTGDQAVSYGRFRHDACGDPCRIKRQQQIERLAIQKLKSEKFNDLTHIAALIDVINRNVQTNLKPEEMRSLGWHFRDINLADVHTQQVAYTTDKDLSCCGNVLVADAAQRTKLVADFTATYLPAAPVVPPSAIAEIKPATLRIAVQNGSGIAGLGAKMAAQLRQRGYTVSSVGNADTFDYDTTQIHPSAAKPLAGERVRTDLNLASAAVTPVPAPTVTANATVAATDVTVIIGRDYAAAASAVPATHVTK